MTELKFVDEINISKKVVLLRVDLNVPLNSKLEITDDNRLVRSIETIKYILSNNSKCILVSHLGRPKGIGYEKKFSLENIVNTLSTLLKTNVLLIKNYFSDGFSIETFLKKSDVILLENIRFQKEEKLNDEGFAKKLASFADIYVNDAFGTTHRKHASTYSIVKYFNQKCAGLLIKSEVENIHKLLSIKKSPFTAILGGSKVSDKIDIIKKLIRIVDNIIIGGAMSNTFIKFLGGNIGDSMYEAEKLSLVANLIDDIKNHNVNLYLPKDVICSKGLHDFNNIKIFDSDDIPKGYSCYDIGDKSISIFSNIIINSKKVIWNGPMGVFENENFSNGTLKITDAIVKATSNDTFSLVGGGDSVAAIKKSKKMDKISFISTGGGALIEYISRGITPCLKLLENK